MAGYHLFASGEVLTAANANGYLMNQTVMVFASAAARTSALAGVLAEGMASYRTDSHVLEYYNGSAWVTASIYAAPTLGSTSIGSGATVTNIAGLALDQSVNAQTGTTYTPVLTDDNKIVTLNNAATIAVTIPTNASVAYAVGARIDFAWITGAGQPTISAVTPGTTTILSTGATSTSPKIRVVNGMASAVKIATDTWLVAGDIS